MSEPRTRKDILYWLRDYGVEKDAADMLLADEKEIAELKAEATIWEASWHEKCGQLKAAKAEIAELKSALAECRELIGYVDNGHCMICRGFRKWDTSTRPIKAGPCENPDCLSHKLERLLK